ncbi:hypothetical protein [Xanthobacter flavus]|uniref:hypothetical protein n=1 Tax=Xanthobacter flavus TaxID=281 RepID=UPI001AE4AF60|nr:hypothetical protein [Xanthobacter flavus]MBP2147931.1 hypothetical protein [Xanthobacter flavus]
MGHVLVLLACLAADPATCREERVPLDLAASRAPLPMECAGAAMEWAAAHPAFIVRRFACRPFDREA